MSHKIAVITSTTRPTRAGRVFADWFMEQAKNVSNLEFELIDIAEENLPFLEEVNSPNSGKYELDYTKAWSKKIAGYDGYVFVVAEYNNGYPAPLKNAMDTLFHEWGRKPAAFVGYGTVGAARAVEHLANVVAKLNMMPLTSNVVHIIEPWNAVDEVGVVKPEFVKGRVEGLFENLTWWTQILADARKSTK